jgi:hypothetical protein
MNKTSDQNQLRRDTPEVSHTAKSLAYCVMLSAVMNGNEATFNSFNDAGRSTPILRDRRRVLGGIAASCAGLAGTAIVSFNLLPLRQRCIIHKRPAANQGCGLGRSDSGRDQCRDDPRIQAKRRLYLQGCFLRRIYFRCEPQIALCKTSAIFTHIS